jgi:tRNA (guanine-N7-)-methyltransferase
MPRTKLRKFQEIETRKNVIETSYPSSQNIDIDWPAHFGNDNPIILELACGNGEYTNGLAALYKDKNYIGVDIKGERIWQASTDSFELGLKNTAFLRCQIDHLTAYFRANQISEIWIIHPDPFLKESNSRKRLTSAKFLNIYRKICKLGTIIHLKTDSQPLFESTIEVLNAQNITPISVTKDLYNSDLLKENHNIVTKFEQKALNQNGFIYYMKFHLS